MVPRSGASTLGRMLAICTSRPSPAIAMASYRLWGTTFPEQLAGLPVEASSVYEDPYRWSIKITEAPQAGRGHAALRTSSPEALERRAKALRDTNVDLTWTENERPTAPEP